MPLPPFGPRVRLVLLRCAAGVHRHRHVLPRVHSYAGGAERRLRRGLLTGVRVFCFFYRSRTIQDSTKRPPRVNRQIRISPVRVIGADGSQLGILEVDAALSMAQELGLDLVEVAAAARPPVVRIMDYGKFKFEQAKQARLAKKKQHVIHLKEVKYRPGIDDHDFDTKTRHARQFLEEGNKVKVTLMFRGRQIAHPELGRAVVERVSQQLADLAKIESAPTMEGKSMTMILAPK